MLVDIFKQEDPVKAFAMQRLMAKVIDDIDLYELINSDIMNISFEDKNGYFKISFTGGKQNEYLNHHRVELKLDIDSMEQTVIARIAKLKKLKEVRLKEFENL